MNANFFSRSGWGACVVWTEERLAADRLILTKKFYNWNYIKFIFRFFLLRKDESKVEEEAYAQAKEEKEEDEGTFQVDYLLHLQRSVRVLCWSWAERPEGCVQISPGFVLRLSPVWSVHSGSWYSHECYLIC